MKNGLTAPQRALIESGHTPESAARRLAGKRLTPRQLREKAGYVRRVVREGGAGFDYAIQLARVIGCRADWLMLPRDCWPDDARGHFGNLLPQGLTPQGAVETPARETASSRVATAATGRAEASASRSLRRQLPSSNRMTVLRKV